MKTRGTTLRQYRLSDIPKMLPLLRKGIKELPHYSESDFDEEVARRTLEFNCGQDMQIVIFVICDPSDSPVGGICYAVQKGFVSNDIYAWDLFFWIDPEWRSLANAEKLIIAAREWSLKRGVKLRNFRATITGGYKMEKLGKLMEFMGMESIGTIYQYANIKHR